MAGKKWTEKSDMIADKKAGIPEGGRRDQALDKKRGLPPDKPMKKGKK